MNYVNAGHNGGRGSRYLRLGMLLTLGAVVALSVLGFQSQAVGQSELQQSHDGQQVINVRRDAGGNKISTPRGLASAAQVRGHISFAATGKAYPGAWVEFKNVYGGNVHTQTNANGDYSLPVPDGVYTALAGSDDMNMSFTVVGPDNTVQIPPDTRVDFVARPIH